MVGRRSRSGVGRRHPHQVLQAALTRTGAGHHLHPRVNPPLTRPGVGATGPASIRSRIARSGHVDPSVHPYRHGSMPSIHQVAPTACCSACRSRRRSSSGFADAGNRDVEGLVAVADPPDSLDEGDRVADRPATAGRDRRHPVPPSGSGGRGGAGPGPAHPDGNPRGLHRRREADARPPRPGDPIVRSSKCTGSPVHSRDTRSRCSSSISPRTRGSGSSPQSVPLVRAATRAHAEDQPTLAQPVKGRGLPRHHERAPTWQRCHQRSQPDAGGATGRGGERDPGVDDVHRSRGEGEQMIPDEEAVPAGAFGASRPSRRSARHRRPLRSRARSGRSA